MKKVIAIIVFLFTTTAFAASFDCSRASTPIENAICSYPELSALDEQLASVYYAATASAVDKNQFKTEQRTWLTQVRNKCEDTNCLALVYKNRINVLREGASNQPQVSQPEPTPVESYGVVTTQSTPLNIRAGPGEEYQVTGKAPKGITLRILGKVGSWYQIQDETGLVGYARSDYIQLVPGNNVLREGASNQPQVSQPESTPVDKYSISELNRKMRASLDEIKKLEAVREQSRVECANGNDDACVKMGVDPKDPCRPYLTQQEEQNACRIQQCNNGNQVECGKVNAYNNLKKKAESDLQRQHSKEKRTCELDCSRDKQNCRKACSFNSDTDGRHHCNDKCDSDYHTCEGRWCR